MKNRKLVASMIAATAVLASVGCSGGSSGATGSSTISSTLWDPAQLPVYKECAAAFKQKTGITVNVTQAAWASYWPKLTTQLASGAGPDVFTDHVNYFDQFASSGQLLDLKPYLDKAGYKVDTTAVPSNALWASDGKQYALSQDQDVTGLVYNEADLDATWTAKALGSLTWNPDDGGTFQKMIAHLTVDSAGVRGDQPGFNKSKVKTYGFSLLTGGGVSGQISWSFLALSTGWTYSNKNPYPTSFNFDDPKMVATWTWLQKMYTAGYIAPPALVTSLGDQPLLDQNKAATIISGSWTASTRLASTAQKFQWAALPAGPVGHPVSISNSIGPSVNAGTKNPEAAAKWAEFIVSPDCANIVAKSAVEIPVDPQAAQTALATLKTKGVDTAAWGTLFANKSWLAAWPLPKNGGQINDLSNTAFDVTLPSNKGTPQKVLDNLNTQLDGLVKQ